MSFLSAGFLLGLVSVAVPVIIHLIYRQRYPDRPFTTLRFFDKTLKHNVIQRKLIDKIILLLRILALLALMFGLARPFTSSGGVGERRRSIVIVLDNSPSMGRLRDGKTLFDRAKAAAAVVLDQLQANSGDAAACDQAQLILTAAAADPAFTTDRAVLKEELANHAGEALSLWAGKSTAGANTETDAGHPEFTTDSAKLSAAIEHAPAGVPLALVQYGAVREPKLSYNIPQLRALLERSRISALPGNIRQAIANAGNALRASTDGERRIIILSDLQKSEWQGAKIEGLENLSVTLAAIDPPAEESANLGIESVVPAVREAVLGQSVMCTATVRNYGTRASDQAKMMIVAGDRGRASELKLQPLAPNASTLVSFPINVMTRERNLLCSATLKSATDSFNYDDTWYFQIGVRPPVSTLCVNGAAGASVSDKETFFVMNALAPRPASNATGGGQTEILADVRECEVSDIKNQQLFQYGVIVLAGVTTLDADTREKLRRFVNDGGGLLVFPGPKAALDDYNAWGFLPAKLIERKNGDFAYVKSLADDAPALAGVKQRIGGGINALSTSSWILLEPDGQPETSVLAHLSSNAAPALIQGRVGKGTVILSAVGCHVSGSDWPLRPAFVILARNLVKYLGNPASPVTLAPDRLVGEGASSIISPDLAAGTPALFHMTQKVKGNLYAPLPWSRNAAAVVMPQAEISGHYLLLVQPGITEGLIREPGLGAGIVPVSVNHSSRESVLDSLPINDAGALLAGTKLTAKRLPQNADEAAVIVTGEIDSGRDLWRWLLLSALAFLAVESLLAGRTSSETAAG